MKGQLRNSALGSMLPGLTMFWEKTTGTPQVRVAVIDGPVDVRHSAFQSAQLLQLSGVSVDGGANPATTHGTRVAGLLFGSHASDTPGVTPDCTGLIVPVFHGSSEGSTGCSQSDLAQAIGMALQHRADVINISGGQLSGDRPDRQLHDVLRQCEEEKVIVVAAAGNDGCDCTHLPAADPWVIAVGGMDSAGEPLQMSNWGSAYSGHALLAPGADILAPQAGGGVSIGTGTSWAAPLVSGVLALALSLQKQIEGSIDPLRVVELLLATAVQCDEQPSSHCDRLFAGRLNVRRLLSCLLRIGTEEMSDVVTPVATAAEPEIVSAGECEALLEAAQPLSTDSVETSGRLLVKEKVTALASSPSLVGEASIPEVIPSGCGCQQEPTLVYSIGTLGYDFGSEARMDSFIQQGLDRPADPGSFLEHLSRNEADAEAVTWTLLQEATPIYAIRPSGPFAQQVYQRLRDFLAEQVKAGAERISVPGVVSGTTQLLNGQVVTVIRPELRGMYNWTTEALLKEVATDDNEAALQGVHAFLQRVYYEFRNMGLTSQERAINYAATNAYQVEEVFHRASREELHIQGVDVERSPICRPGSECWDVRITFFHPSRRLEEARHVFRFTVDVSDVVPVTVGQVRYWPEY